MIEAKQIIEDMDNLRHMLGMTRKVADYGFRNYYNTCDGHPALHSMLRMEASGLVRRGQQDYWHATEAGCKAVGLNTKQIKRAMGD